MIAASPRSPNRRTDWLTLAGCPSPNRAPASRCSRLFRRNFGEIMENIAGWGEYHWMAGNFIKYGAPPLHASDLPVDTHELIALCAPRPVLITIGTNTGGPNWPAFLSVCQPVFPTVACASKMNRSRHPIGLRRLCRPSKY
jgi:hypothetical protein